MDSSFAALLLAWYDRNKRDLPWRDTGNAYHTWISEIMLQQTRAETVKPYFLRFVREIPDIGALAAIPDEKLFVLWEGLGYYSRARNLKKAALQMKERYNERLPEDPAALRTLAGIGEYTSGAIASIAYGVPAPAVDGNVLRIWARLTEYPEGIMAPAAKQKAGKWAEERMPEDRPGDFNQALMDLGAMICLPNGRALCDECPLKSLCSACLHKTVPVYPVRTPKKERRIEKKTVLVIQDGNMTAIRQRPAEGLLAGLYELPNLEGFCSPREAEDYVKSLGLFPLRITPLPEAKHIFTHIEWKMRGYLVRVSGSDNLQDTDLLFVNKEQQRGQYAVPSAFRAYREYMKEEQT